MRIFRRLPPLLRVASLFGLLCALASITLLVSALVTSLRSLPKSSPDFGREVVIGLNLVMLGGACSFAVNTYSTRFRRPDRGPFPLASWQSQVLAIVLPAALPICALALAVVIPPTALAWLVVIFFSVIAAVVLLAANLYAVVKWHALT